MKKTIDCFDQDLLFKTSINPESIRIIAHIGLCLIVLISQVITHYLADPNEIHNSPVAKIWGHQSICIALDYAPAIYIAPFLWSVELLLLIPYVVFSWVRTIRLSYKFKIRKNIIISLTSIVSYQILSFCLFSLIFAVQPEQNLLIHTLPYVNLVFAMTLFELGNFYSYKILEILNRKEVIIGTLYLALHVLFSVILIINMLKQLFYETQIGSILNGLMPFYHPVEKYWFFIAIICPIIISFFIRKRITSMVLTY